MQTLFSRVKGRLAYRNVAFLVLVTAISAPALAGDVFNNLPNTQQTSQLIRFGWVTDTDINQDPFEEGTYQYKLQTMSQNFSLNQGQNVSSLSFRALSSSFNVGIYRLDPVTRVLTPTGFSGVAVANNGVATLTVPTPVSLSYGVYTMVFSDTRDFMLNASRNITNVPPGPDDRVSPSYFYVSSLSATPPYQSTSASGNFGPLSYLGGARRGFGPYSRYHPNAYVENSELPTYLTPAQYANNSPIAGPINPTLPIKYFGVNPDNNSTLPRAASIRTTAATTNTGVPSYVPSRLEGTPNGLNHPLILPTANQIYTSVGQSSAFRPEMNPEDQLYSIAGGKYQKRTATFVATAAQTELAIKFITDFQSFNFTGVRVTDNANPTVNIVSNGDFSAPGPVNGNVVVKQYQYTRNGETVISGQTAHPEQQPEGWTLTAPTDLTYTSGDLVGSRFSNFTDGTKPVSQVLPTPQTAAYDPVTQPYLYPDVRTALGNADIGIGEAGDASFIPGSRIQDALSITHGVVNEGLTVGSSTAYHAISLGGFSTLAQLINTIPGHTYTFEYYERSALILDDNFPFSPNTNLQSGPNIDLLSDANLILQQGTPPVYDGTASSLSLFSTANQVQIYATAVPEPTGLLIGLASLGVLQLRRSRA